MTPVPYVDFPAQYEAHREELREAVDRALRRGDHILGCEVTAFEESFARLCGCRFALGVANGTDALVLVLKAMGVGAGDEVITAPNSYVASAAAIALAGARPVFADVRADYNLDPAAVERAITPRTRAVIVVHLTGRPADMEAFARLGVPVIEDAAQAVGAQFDGRPVGSFGRAGCFSMHPLKNLNACGDAGAITTNDAELWRQLRLWRNHGLESRDLCRHWGYNSRLDNVQAAILNVRLRHLDAVTQARRETAAYYREHLPDGVGVPRDGPRERSVYHTFTVTVEHRDAVRRALAERGVETRIHYPVPIHLQPAAAYLGYRRGDLPVAESLADRILSLPVYPELSAEQKAAVVEAMRAALGS